ncbi:MAG: hypothetical protein BAJATHORv1_30054 [Candidatus Thorarchaeota archaeon]|nr:MAG: hypothetical protein BAJATHORv1_30054 [Candidatus Thorarchaeota archaeon]
MMSFSTRWRLSIWNIFKAFIQIGFSLSFTMPNSKIIFVYNADSGILNATKDFFHRLISPDTYQCNLCAVTYNNTGMISEWKSFLDSLDISVEILHKDEFNNRHNFDNPSFPSAFLLKNGKLSYFISAEKMNSVSSVDELIDMVRAKMQEESETS